MKKLFFVIAAAASLAACSKHGTGVKTHTITFEESYYSPFVATKSFSHDFAGKTYDAKHIWVDPTTQLSTAFPAVFNNIPDKQRYGYDYPWIVSQYQRTELKNEPDYSSDLSIYGNKGGHNGSKSFIVGYGYNSEFGDTRPIFTFADKKARVIRSVFVNSTACFLESAFNDPKTKLAAGEKVTVTVTGYDAAGKETKNLSFILASVSQSGTAMKITEWKEIDLSSLGKVVSVKFDQGGKNNAYGYALSAYIALDDITVEL